MNKIKKIHLFLHYLICYKLPLSRLTKCADLTYDNIAIPEGVTVDTCKCRYCGIKFFMWVYTVTGKTHTSFTTIERLPANKAIEKVMPHE